MAANEAPAFTTAAGTEIRRPATATASMISVMLRPPPPQAATAAATAPPAAGINSRSGAGSASNARRTLGAR